MDCPAHRCRPGLLAVGFFTACALAFSLALSSARGATPPVTATHAWFRYILPQVPAGGYVTLQNASAQPMTLTAASSAACRMLMLHRTLSSGGEEQMVPIEKVTVPAHGSFRFAPDGYHMMCMHPRMQIGQTVMVTLTFADGSRLQVPFTVYGANGAPDAAPQGSPMKMPQMKM